jgi:hypothetical protein
MVGNNPETILKVVSGQVLGIPINMNAHMSTSLLAPPISLTLRLANLMCT